MSTEHRYAVPGLERGLAILQLFDRNRTSLGAADVARELGIPRTTVFRLMQTLAHLEFLERDDRQFRLGPAILRLGFEYLASLELTELAQPILERLRDGSGFSTQLVIRDRTEVVVVQKASMPSTFASTVTVGSRLPAHTTVIGRMLLADLDDAALRELYPATQLPGPSERGPRSFADLRRMLAEDRARGYAVSESFYETGISAVAVPVRDGTNRVVATLSIVVPRANLAPPELRERLVRQVREAAQELSNRLNYRAAPVRAAVAA